MFSNLPMLAILRGVRKPRPTSMARSCFWLFAHRLRLSSGIWTPCSSPPRHSLCHLILFPADDAPRGLEDIAARFGVTPTLLRQRLKLACVSPKFMQIYRDGLMSFDQLMAFRETKVYQYRAIVQGN